MSCCLVYIKDETTVLLYREEITHPTSSSAKKPPSDVIDLSGGKKIRKFYSIIPERWNLADKIEKEKFHESKQIYLKIVGQDELAVKKEIIEGSREYLQPQFRQLEVREHVSEHKEFWALPDGPFLVSFQFEWLTGGSEVGWLAVTIEKNLEIVLGIVAQIISEKKGGLWDKQFEEVHNNAGMINGNQTMVWVFLLREWSKLYKEKPYRVVYVEGQDDVQEVSKQPYVHVREVPQPGEDYAKKVVVSVMCGNIMVFEDLGFSAALASVIEMCFIFNLCYDKDGDSTLNFVQRVLGGFGDLDGARNAKGQVKSSYINLQAEFGKIMVDKNLGFIKKTSTV